MVADHRVGGDQRLPPALQRIDQRQSAAPGAVEPGPDLPRPVAVPDVGVQDRHEPVLVGGEFGRQPGEQERQSIPVPAALTVAVAAAVAEE